MPARNLADPSFEPSDEDFRELLHRAMEGARAGHEAAERAMREQIAAESTRLRAERASRPSGAR